MNITSSLLGRIEGMQAHQKMTFANASGGMRARPQEIRFNNVNKRSALVTGSTSGIGLGIARTLAKHGCDIVLNGFGPEAELKELQNKLRSEFNVRVAFHGADMSKPKEIEDLIKFAKNAHEGIDILVNNAGIQHVSPVESFPAEKWDQIIAINLSAVFHATRFTIPIMKDAGWGRIINIASVHGLVASVNKSAYVAAKHGVIGLTKTVALELAQSRITCNAICPGWVMTPLVEKQVLARAEKEKVDFAEAKHRLLLEKQPSGEMATPEQIGELVAFLGSDAAAQITGSAMTVDGGWVAQ